MCFSGRLLLLVAVAIAACRSTRLQELQREAARNPQPAFDRILEGPQEIAPLQEGPQRVVLRMQRNVTPTVRARINGRNVLALLDTGTDTVVLPEREAAEAKIYLPEGHRAEALSPTGRVPLRMGVARDVQFGGMRLGPVTVAIPERVAGELLDREGRMIVGSPVLGSMVMRLDFARRIVVLEQRPGPASGRQLLIADCIVNGAKLRLLVDTGADGIYLEPRAARRAGLLVRHPKSQRVFRVRRFLVAERMFYGVPVRILRTFEGREDEFPDTMGGVRPDGLLGLAGLGPRAWYLDLGRRILRVEG